MKNFLRLSVLAMMLALLAGCSKDEPEKGDGGEGGDNGGNTPGPVYEEAQVNSDLWTATDPLGRKLPDYEQAGTKKKNLKSATPFPKCYLHQEEWTFDS